MREILFKAKRKDNETKMTYKQAFANTLCDMCNNLPKGLTDCESYGMTWGCDKDCPTFKSGICEVCSEDFQVFKNLVRNIENIEDKKFLYDLYGYEFDEEVK